MFSRRIALAGLLLAALFYASQQVVFAQEGDVRFSLDAADQQAVMRFFRSRIAAGLGDEKSDAPSWFSEPLRIQGILSLYCNASKRVQVEAEGSTPLDLCENLARSMGLEIWKLPDGAKAVEEGILKMDFILRRERSNLRLDLPLQNESETGLRGYAIHEGEADPADKPAAWFTPLDALRVGRTGNLLQAMYREKGREAPRRWNVEAIHSYAVAEKEPGGDAYRFYRTGPLLEDLAKEDIVQSFLKAAGWLMNLQDTSGQFVLRYDPFTQRVGRRIRVRDSRRDNDYLLMEHLRAVEPLLRVYEPMEDERLLRSAELALRYARERVVTLDAPDRTELGEDQPSGPKEEICYVGQNDNLARATALMLAAECRMAQAQRSGATGLMRKLAKTLVLMIDEQGFMGFTLRDLMRGDTPHSQDNDVPGRTVYALTLLHELDPNEEWITAATRVGLARLLPGSSDRFERNPWDVIAMARLYRAEHPEARHYAIGEFIRKTAKRTSADEIRERFCTGAYVHGAGLLASARRDKQWLVDRAEGRPLNPRLETDLKLRYYWPGSTDYEDYIGGFINPGAPPRVLSAAIRLRALAAVHSVALIKSPEDLTFRKTIKKLALPISRFLIRQQFSPANSFYIKNPELVQGAFRESPTDFTTRMATTAEAILALMDALEILDIKHADPTLD